MEYLHIIDAIEWENTCKYDKSMVYNNIMGRWQRTSIGMVGRAVEHPDEWWQMDKSIIWNWLCISVIIYEICSQSLDITTTSIIEFLEFLAICQSNTHTHT